MFVEEALNLSSILDVFQMKTSPQVYSFEVVGIYVIGIDNRKHIQWMKSDVCDGQHNVIFVKWSVSDLGAAALDFFSSLNFCLYMTMFSGNWHNMKKYSPQTQHQRHEISLQQLLSPQGRRCKKCAVSVHIQAKHQRHIAWFLKHIIKLKYV